MKIKLKALLRILPVTLLAVMALTATAVPVGAAAAAGAWTAPFGGSPGSVVTVTGTGFTATAPYSITFQGSTVASGTVLAGGNISASFQVPLVPRGNYTLAFVSATDTAPDKIFTVAPVVMLSAPSGAVGSQLAVLGRGFAPFVTVSVHLDSPTNPSLIQTTTDVNGVFTTQFFAIPQTTKGAHSIFTQETVSGVYSSASFVVNSGITLSAATGNTGDTITITGSAFAAGNGTTQNVTFELDGVAITGITAATSTNGSFTKSNFVIPTTTRGVHVITAKDSVGNTATANFTVTPKITLTPTTGAVGSSVTVTGSGFSGSSTINFEFDGAAITGVTSIQSNATGGFTKVFIIPNTTAGNHTIAAIDGSGFVEATFSVAANIILTPNSGTAGSLVTITGNGFQPTGSVTITYDNVVLTTATLTSGSFNASFTVPGGMAGAHTVRATDGLSNTATAAFTATLSATLSPITSAAAPGYVGQDLTVTGTGFLPNAAITVKFGDANIGSATSSATGAFTVTFKVPAVAKGDHLITVTDTTNTRTFTFVMEGDAPDAPVLTLPSSIEKPKQPVVYEWGAVTDPSGVTYTLEVGNDSTFATVFMQKTGLTTASYTATDAEKLPTVSKDAPYYWRVIATDGAGNVGAASTPQTFVVGFSFSDLIPDNFPVWAWVVIGVFAVVIIGGLVYYFYRRSYSY